MHRRASMCAYMYIHAYVTCICIYLSLCLFLITVRVYKCIYSVYQA